MLGLGLKAAIIIPAIAADLGPHLEPIWSRIQKSHVPHRLLGDRYFMTPATEEVSINGIKAHTGIFLPRADLDPHSLANYLAQKSHTR